MFLRADAESPGHTIASKASAEINDSNLDFSILQKNPLPFI
jgi:hypothetical protein